MDRVDRYNREQLSSLSEEELLALIELGARAFQEENKLAVDGMYGPNSRRVMRDQLDKGDETSESITQSPSLPAPKAGPNNDGLREVYGDFDYKPDPNQRGGILIEKRWRYANIVKTMLHTGRHVWLHRMVSEEFASLFERACFESGYHPERIGSFVPRHILWNPAKKLSTHSWGIAVDFDPKQNGYGVPIERTIIGQRIRFAEVFEAAGWIWGGRWRTPDSQHFQRALP